MYTWGRNQFGQLGHDDTKDQYFPKLVDIQFVYFVDMAGGYFHSVAISGEQILDHVFTRLTALNIFR